MRCTSWLVASLAAICLASAEEACEGDACSSQDPPADSSLMQTSHLAKAFPSKSGTPHAALAPEDAIAAKQARKPLVLEGDLAHVVQQLSEGGVLPKAPKLGASKEEFSAHVEVEFKRLATDIGLIGELTPQEFDAFRGRYVSAMLQNRKSIKSDHEWSVAIGAALEDQKPLMTAAVVASINSAGLGFKANMWKWLIHETKSTSQRWLGFKPREGRKSVYGRKASARQVEYDRIPTAFRAEEKWPMCTASILRIHNQGHCGSCWAFSGLAPLDARMCIVTNGTWNKPEHTLSRLQALSCAPFSVPEYAGMTSYDGCAGGEPSWVFDMMADRGVVSTNCLPYYITGEGVEHFSQSERGPPCVSHCQQNYNLPMEQDAYVSQGVGNYDLLLNVHGDTTSVANMKIAMYTEGPVSFAFKVVHDFFGYAGGVWSACDGSESANHAVYAFGWGQYTDEWGLQVEFIEALNSWGTRWGVNGSFRIHPICLVEVAIPGPIESSTMSHDVEEVNDMWPWSKPLECPVDADGCVTDMERDQNYTAGELCFSDKLNGKKIRVAEFSTEYGYDMVTINGHHFYGAEGNGLFIDTLTSLVVDDRGLKFESDGSVEFPGFKLCPVEPETDNETDVNETVDDLPDAN